MNEETQPAEQVTSEAPQEINFADLSIIDQRRIRRFVEKAQLGPKPLTASVTGALASDSDGRVYIREVRKTKQGKAAAGNVRVIFDDQGQPMRAGHKNKTVRKAELKALRIARKNRVRESRAVKG